MALGKYRVAAITGGTGGGVSGSVNAIIDAVLKCNTPNAPYCIPNEMICSTIGQFIGLPVPPTGIMFSPGNRIAEHWFGSLNFNLTGNALPPVDPARCGRELPDLSTGLLLFDLLVANSDRHRGNLSVDFSLQPPRMDVFDHSHALCGNSSGDAELRFVGLRTHLGISGGTYTGGNRHCLLDHLTTDAHFAKWLQRVVSLPDYVIEDVCNAAVSYGITTKEAEGATNFLCHRRDNLLDIIHRHRHEFSAISQWSLFQ